MEEVANGKNRDRNAVQLQTVYGTNGKTLGKDLNGKEKGNSATPARGELKKVMSHALDKYSKCGNLT